MNKKPLEIYLINNSKLKKLYFLYIHQSLFDKILDFLVILAVLLTVFTFFLEIFFKNNKFLYFLHFISFAILIIFIFETLRDYIKSKSFRHYLNKYWIDFILIAFLGLYFTFSGFLGFAKVRIFEISRDLIEDSKRIRVVFSTFFKK